MGKKIKKIIKASAVGSLVTLLGGAPVGGNTPIVGPQDVQASVRSEAQVNSIKYAFFHTAIIGERLGLLMAAKERYLSTMACPNSEEHSYAEEAFKRRLDLVNMACTNLNLDFNQYNVETLHRHLRPSLGNHDLNLLGKCKLFRKLSNQIKETGKIPKNLDMIVPELAAIPNFYSRDHSVLTTEQDLAGKILGYILVTSARIEYLRTQMDRTSGEDMGKYSKLIQDLRYLNQDLIRFTNALIHADPYWTDQVNMVAQHSRDTIGVQKARLDYAEERVRNKTPGKYAGQLKHLDKKGCPVRRYKGNR